MSHFVSFMAPAKKNASRKLDGRSLRYLGLMAGLLGLLYLNWLPPEHLPDRATNDAVQPAGPQSFAAKDDSRSEALREALVEALWRADEAAVAQLIADGIDVNAALDRRQTRAMHLLFFGSGCEYGASARGVMPVLELLLAQGARVNVADSRGNTPLMLAAAECDPPVVRRLLAAGAEMAAENLLGLTAFELTLSNASAAGLALTDAGFRLPEQRYREYRAVYHDEPQVLTHLEAARPERP